MFLGYPDVGAVFGTGHRYECLGLDIQPPFESNSLIRIHARSHPKVTENLRSSCRRREMVNDCSGDHHRRKAWRQGWCSGVNASTIHNVLTKPPGKSLDEVPCRCQTQGFGNPVSRSALCFQTLLQPNPFTVPQLPTPSSPAAHSLYHLTAYDALRGRI
jgi:hypothetical protein